VNKCPEWLVGIITTSNFLQRRLIGYFPILVRSYTHPSREESNGNRKSDSSGHIGE
jgi:hypothetical protein